MKPVKIFEQFIGEDHEVWKNVGHGGFDKLAKKAAKEYGSKEAGKRVAAAAMWKGIHRK